MKKIIAHSINNLVYTSSTGEAGQTFMIDDKMYELTAIYGANEHGSRYLEVKLEEYTDEGN